MVTGRRDHGDRRPSATERQVSSLGQRPSATHDVHLDRMVAIGTTHETLGAEDHRVEGGDQRIELRMGDRADVDHARGSVATTVRRGPGATPGSSPVRATPRTTSTSIDAVDHLDDRRLGRPADQRPRAAAPRSAARSVLVSSTRSAARELLADVSPTYAPIARARRSGRRRPRRRCRRAGNRSCSPRGRPEPARRRRSAPSARGRAVRASRGPVRASERSRRRSRSTRTRSSATAS